MEYAGKLHFGYVITVCSREAKNCPMVFSGFGNKEHWDIDDPAATIGTEELKLDKFREIRDKIAATVKRCLESQTADADSAQQYF